MTTTGALPEQGGAPVVILVPVLGRPHRVQPLLHNIAAATPQPHRVVFIPDPGDHAERDAIAAAGAEQIPWPGGYAAKINQATRATSEPLLFFAADDLTFHAGWLPAATRRVNAAVHVVGVNDLIARRTSRRKHATHFLVTRQYVDLACIDGTPGPLHDGYRHNFVDDEFIGTAEQRRAYRYAADAHVQHDHPMIGAPDDATYRKGRASWQHDQELYKRRRRLWTR